MEVAVYSFAQFIDVLELNIGHVAQVLQLANQGGLDWRVLPNKEQYGVQRPLNM